MKGQVSAHGMVKWPLSRGAETIVERPYPGNVAYNQHALDSSSRERKPVMTHLSSESSSLSSSA